MGDEDASGTNNGWREEIDMVQDNKRRERLLADCRQSVFIPPPVFTGMGCCL